MLRTLYIRDFVIIDQVTIDFNKGFTVLSGETGAGKSILIDALSLLIGGRADASVVRESATKADLSAEFNIYPEVQTWLHTQELDDTHLLIRRVIDTQGRSKCFINGQVVSQTQLKDLGELLIDIHGQHAHQSLLKQNAQLLLLDNYAGLNTERQQLAELWKNWRDQLKTLVTLEEESQKAASHQEQLAWQLEALNQLNLQPDEWQTIQAEHKRLIHAQSLIKVSEQSLQLLDESDHCISAQIRQTLNRLNALLEHDNRLQTAITSLEQAELALAEAISELNSYLNKTEIDPNRLNEVEKRLEEIFSTARKLKQPPDHLIDFRNSLSAARDLIENNTDLARLKEKVKQAEQAYAEKAVELSRNRKKHAATLAEKVSHAMQSLAMEGGQFSIEISATSPSANGQDTVDFLVAGHPGISLRPLSKVASGGELARISLAISVMSSQASGTPILIFDEVDSGIGGAVAEVVGKQLKQLAQHYQVLCVTHLAQVAAHADHHLLVSKQTSSSQTRSEIRALQGPERIEEIARMLGGIEITATTRQHAQEMLAH